MACAVNLYRLDQDGSAAAPDPDHARGGEDDSADGDAVPVSVVGNVHRARRRVGGRHVIGRLVGAVRQRHVRP